MIRWLAPPNDGYQVSRLSTQFGSLWVAFVEDAIVAASFAEEQPSRYQHHAVSVVRLPQWVADIFFNAFAGVVPAEWQAVDSGLTSLERILISQASEVPFGTTCSYGTLAIWAGFPGRARAAGRAMSRSNIAYLVPTHRVVHADGRPAPCQRNALTRALRLHEGIVLP